MNDDSKNTGMANCEQQVLASDVIPQDFQTSCLE